MVLEIALGITAFSTVSFWFLWLCSAAEVDRLSAYAKSLEQQVKDAHALLREILN